MAKTEDDRATASRAENSENGMQEASQDPYLLARTLTSVLARVEALELTTTEAVEVLKMRSAGFSDSIVRIFQRCEQFDDRIESLSRSINVLDNRTRKIAVLEDKVFHLMDQVRSLSEEVSRLKPSTPEPPAEKPLGDDDLVNLNGWIEREDLEPFGFNCVGVELPAVSVMHDWLKAAAIIKGINPVKSTGGPLYPVYLYRTVAKYIGTGKSEKLGRDGLIKYLVMADGMQKACNGKA